MGLGLKISFFCLHGGGFVGKNDILYTFFCGSCRRSVLSYINLPEDWNLCLLPPPLLFPTAPTHMWSFTRVFLQDLDQSAVIARHLRGVRWENQAGIFIIHPPRNINLVYSIPIFISSTYTAVARSPPWPFFRDQAAEAEPSVDVVFHVFVC